MQRHFPETVATVVWLLSGLFLYISSGVVTVLSLSAFLFIVIGMFAAAIVGGIGNPIGAIVGGYVIAFSEVVVTYAYKKVFIYLLPQSLEPQGLMQLLSTDYKFAVSFMILVLVLLIKPTGILKGKVL